MAMVPTTIAIAVPVIIAVRFGDRHLEVQIDCREKIAQLIHNSGERCSNFGRRQVRSNEPERRPHAPCTEICMRKAPYRQYHRRPNRMPRTAAPAAAIRAAIMMARRRPILWESAPNSKPPQIAPTLATARHDGAQVRIEMMLDLQKQTGVGVLRPVAEEVECGS